MPTIKEDITLSQTSYTDHPDDLDINSSDPKEVKLAQRWEDMKKDGWEYLGNQDMMKPPPTNGFQAQAYRSPEGEVVAAIRGTGELKDWDDNAKLVFHRNPAQKNTAIDFVNNVIEKEDYPDEVHITGHSLGGYLAAEVTAHLNSNEAKYTGITSGTGSGFNNPGIGEADEQSTAFVNISHETDQVNHVGGEHLGPSIDLEGDIPMWRVLTAHGSDELAEIIIGDYPEIANMSSQEFASLSPGERQDLIAYIDDLNATADHNAENAGAQSDSDAAMHESERGEGEYDPDSIVGFVDGKPVTAAEAGLVSDPDAPINQLGSGPGGSAGINPTWGGNDLNNDGIVSDAELLNLQKSAIESGLRGVNDLYNAIDGGDWLGVVDSGLDVSLAIDQYLDTKTDGLGGGSEGFISEGMEQSNPLFISWNAPRNEPKKRTLSRRATRSLCFSAKTGAAELTRISLKQSSRLSVLSCDARRL